MRKKAVTTAILLFWIIMLALLVERTYLRPTTVIALDAVTAEGLQKVDEWFGIYQQERKIGFAHTSIKPEEETYHLFEESELNLLVLGSVQRVRTVINSYTTRNFLLKYFDFSMASGVTSMRVKGAVVKKNIVLDISTGGRTRTQRIPFNNPPYLSPGIKPALLLAGLEQGKQYRFPLFNPATMSTEDVRIVVDSRATIKIGDAEQPVYKLKESFQGMETTSWMTENGETLKEESPLGYVLLREPEAEAKKLDAGGPAVDMISLTMIPSDPIADSPQVRYLRLRLSGVDLRGFQLDGAGQTLSGNVVEIRRQDSAPHYRLPYEGRDWSSYLLPSALIQSDDKKIIGEAARIVGTDRDPRVAARKLNEWVYTAIRKRPVVSIPSALEVLSRREGDCNEHTALFTALARAAGIPTRMAAGIVYMENGFYYHAWPEVWLGSWTAVDPTFNQFPADATHIRFVSGSLDRQSEIIRLVGKLRVDVLDYGKRANPGGERRDR